MNPTASRFAILMGSASFLTLTSLAAHAQQVAQAQMMAQAGPEVVPEQVLITGSLIHGAAAVGVPVTNLGTQDFTQSGNVTIGDLFRTVPQANVAPGPSAVNSGGHQERETRVNIRGLDQTGPRTLLMIDGIRFPPQADGLCAIDPSIIPALALDRVDVLADGASATYGSDAIAGVINVILKRNFDGAVTLFHYQQPDKGGQEVQASQLWGRTWEGGDITLTYEFTNENPVKGTAHSNYTVNYTPWGLDNQTPLVSSLPGTITVGKPTGLAAGSVGTVCSNCWAIPGGAGQNFNPALNNGLGPLNPMSAATINWATFSANAANFATNEVNPFARSYELAAQQTNRWVATVDQRLFPGVSVFATAFDSNRRVSQLSSPDNSSGATNDIRTFAVPTINPYYPTNAPSNLQVSYDLSYELPIRQPAYEISYRYSAGFNLDLPFAWSGNLYYSHSYDANAFYLHNVNDNAANVALGNAVTIAGPPGTPNVIYTKPASVPYLNLFCDPRAFQCNSPATLAYIGAERETADQYKISEWGARFDGPLFDLPAGQVKAAVGGVWESDNVVGRVGNNSGSPPATPFSELFAISPYNVWAAFTQVDVPVFGDNLNIPLVRRFDLEGSWRHDQYHGDLAGGTSNPKVGFTWLIDEMVGATVRGGWGTSFRFANAGEYSTVFSDANADFNINGQPGPVHVTCTSGVPTPGSASALLVAAGFSCTGPNNLPGGITWAGGPQPILRSFTNASTGMVQSREGGTALAPEKANNYSIGFELAPQFALLRGLDLQATWYSVKVNGTLLGNNATADNTLGDPNQKYHVILPSDLGCPVAANAAPTTCKPFEAMAAAALSDRNSPSDISFLSSVYWISDGGTVGQGFVHVSGVDFNGSYDFDAGDYGAWNTGLTGTYYLHRWVQTSPGGAIIDAFDQNLSSAAGVAQNGVETLPRMNYRARVGWSNGAFSATAFWNHQSHYYETRLGVPPNVNFSCVGTGSTVGGGTFPCAISNYTGIQPAWDTIDLSLGYNTGDAPANDYLKRITLQLTVQNLMGKHAAFEYGPTTSVRDPGGYDILQPNGGRVIGITVVKNW